MRSALYLLFFLSGTVFSVAADLDWNPETRAIFRFANRSAQSLGYGGGFPTFSIRPLGTNLVLDYHGVVLLNEDAVVAEDVDLDAINKHRDKGKTTEWRSMCRAIHAIAEERGFAGGYPNGEVGKGKIGVIFIKAKFADVKDIKRIDIDSESDVWDRVREDCTFDPEYVGGFLNGHEAVSKRGVVWVKESAGDFVWLLKQ